MEMIKQKLKGQKPIIAAAPERGNVINLMDALKASLGQAKPAAPSKSRPSAAAAKATAKKPSLEASGGCDKAAAAKVAGKEERLASTRWRAARVPTLRHCWSADAPFRTASRLGRWRARGGRLRRGITRQTQRRRAGAQAARQGERGRYRGAAR